MDEQELSEYSLFTNPIRTIGESTLRVVIPKHVLTEQGLEEGDYVKVLIRKITKED